jgi:hypothetical protein
MTAALASLQSLFAAAARAGGPCHIPAGTYPGQHIRSIALTKPMKVTARRTELITL